VDRGGYDRPRRLRTMELSSGKFIAMSDGGIDKAQAPAAPRRPGVS